MKKFYILILFLAFIITNCKNNDTTINKSIFKRKNYPLSAKVIASPSLNVRQSPNIKSSIIGSVTNNSIVNIENLNGPLDFIYQKKVDPIYDRWIKIKFKDITGWVFGFYLNIFEIKNFKIIYHKIVTSFSGLCGTIHIPNGKIGVNFKIYKDKKVNLKEIIIGKKIDPKKNKIYLGLDRPLFTRDKNGVDKPIKLNKLILKNGTYILGLSNIKFGLIALTYEEY